VISYSVCRSVIRITDDHGSRRRPNMVGMGRGDLVEVINCCK